MEPAFKTLRASIPRQPLSPQITGELINKLQQLFQKSRSWLHLAIVPGGKAASWETSGWPYWDRFKHSGASIPRQPLSPQVTDRLINELAEQCQKSRFWTPGRAFEGLKTKTYSTLRQRLLTNPPSTISSAPSIPEIYPLQSGLTPLPSPALHIPPKPTKLCVDQSDYKQE